MGSARNRSIRSSAALALVIIFGGGAIWFTNHADAANVAPEAPVAGPMAAPQNASAARRTAIATGDPVAVTAATTPTESTYANPDGTLTTTLSATPVRVRRGAGWVPLDATLMRHEDGTYGPVASPTRLSLSGGGAEALASMVNGGQQLSIGWPTSLPVPVVAGDTATYPAVLPGVDMRVTANEQGGFSHILIVHDAAAAANPALAELRLTTRTSAGLTLATDEGGNLSATDRDGHALFTAPTPMMWDSSTASPTSDRSTNALAPTGAELSGPDGPGDAAKSAAVGVELTHGMLTLSPDNALLHDTAAHYPIYIDPSWNANSAKSSQNAWTYVSEAHPSQAYLNSEFNDGVARAGYNGWSAPFGRAHSYFQFKIPSAIWKTHVLTARLQITEVWSSSTKSTTMKLFHTGAIGASTTWNKQPSKGAQITSRSVEPAHSASEHPQVDFDVISEITAAAGGKLGITTIGVWNGNETDRDYWRKFQHTPTIAITYNAVPNKPTSPTISPAVPCAGGLVGLTDVTLAATMSDPDGSQTQVEGDFTVNDDTAKKSLGTTKITVSNHKSAASRYASAKFIDGHVYTWSVLAYDGRDKSASTTACHFTVDHTQPAPPDVTDSIVGDVAARTPVTFHFDQPAAKDVPRSYVYALNVRPPAPIPVSDGPFKGGTLVPAAASGPTNLTIRPTRVGNNILYVYAIDAAKNPSPIKVFPFTTNGLTTPDPPGDFTGDGIGDFVGVGAGTHPGLWLHSGTDRKGHVSTTGIDVGADGVQGDGVGHPADWNGASTSTADIDADGAQDVLVRLPGGDTDSGNVLFVPGTGDGSTFDPGTAQPVQLPRIDDEPGEQLVNQIVAVPADSGTLPNLYAVVGDNLYLYQAPGQVGDYDSPELVGSGWTGHTITAARAGADPVLIDRNDSTGKLDSWIVQPAADDAEVTTMTATPLAATGFDRVSVPLLAAGDIDADGRPDVWAVAKTGDLRAYLPATGSPLPAPVVNPIGFAAPS